MRFGLILVCLVTALAASGQQRGTIGQKISLLVFDGCPNSPKMRANLIAALKKSGLPANFETVNLLKLRKDDPRTGYGAPTILLNGKDLFGLPKPRVLNAPSCRLYHGGVPSVAAISAKLRTG